MRLMMVAAVVALAPFSLAATQGGGNPSPFAGTYLWSGGGDAWAVTISTGGQIKGSLQSSSSYTEGSLSGKVGGDGSYAFTMSVTFPTLENPERRTHGPQFRTAHYKFTGVMAPDASGNLVGTPETNESFTWIRQ